MITNNTLNATASTPTGPITTTSRAAAAPNGELQSDGNWANAVASYLSRGNTITIAGHTLDAALFARLTTAPYDTPTMRQTLLRETWGLSGLDYDDLRRFIDDVIIANPTARGRDFSIDMERALSSGVVDRADAPVDFGGQQLRVDNRRASTAPAVAPRAVSDTRTVFLNALRSPALAQQAEALVNRGATAAPGSAERVFADLFAYARTLPSGTAQQILRMAFGAAQAGDLAQLSALSGLAHHPQFLSHDTRQEQILGLARFFGASGPARMVELLDLQVNGRPAIDSMIAGPDTGSNGRTLLDQLQRLNYEHAGLDVARRRDIASALLDQILHPGHINQSIAGTCPVASLQYELSTGRPAELARIVVDLFSSGQSRTARGETLRAVQADAQGVTQNAGGAVAAGSDSRDVVERVVQSALMRNPLQSYNGTNDSGSRNGLPPQIQPGLTDPELQNVTQSVLGDQQTTRNAADGLAYIQAHPGTIAMVGGSWRNINGGTGGHEVSVVGVSADGNTITLRNPQGGASVGGDPIGNFPNATPPRTVLDDNGNFTMTRAAFLAWNPTVVTQAN